MDSTWTRHCPFVDTGSGPGAPDWTRWLPRSISPDGIVRGLSGMPRTTIRLETLHEALPGPGWTALHTRIRHALHRWYTTPSRTRRPSLATASAQLERAMPELFPIWERLVDLADDELTARLLTLWDVPPFLSGCTQVAASTPRPLLVRNYDYDPGLLEGVVASTNWSGSRPVLGTSDLLWGLLDGMNGDGLVVSFTWGGRREHGTGFAIPLVVRYLLETADDVSSALDRLRGIPVAQAYNLTLLDRSGDHASVFVAPGSPPEVSPLRSVANHRLGTVEDAAAWRVRSPERQDAVISALGHHVTEEDLVTVFLTDPVHVRTGTGRYPTLYTAAYRPLDLTLTYHWPGQQWVRRFENSAGSRTVHLLPTGGTYPERDEGDIRCPTSHSRSPRMRPARPSTASPPHRSRRPSANC